MRIAVDAMGGDFAPDEVVRGAVLLASEADFGDEIILVGDRPKIDSTLETAGWSGGGISVRHASEVIAMDEHPAQAIRKKRDSSVVVCGQMVKQGDAEATVSAGNTGAAMAVATLNIGRISGIERPAIVTMLPTPRGNCLLLDAGANVDCSAVNLLQFALMGAVYAKRALGIPNPAIGLLNIGAEETKGNELTKEAHALLKRSHLNFYGNVEGKDLYDHTTDVIVCDGFIGNIALKTSEGLAEMIYGMLQAGVKQLDPGIASSLAPIMGMVAKRIDYAERGGAPLLGIDGVSIIAHGRSKAKAIVNAIRQGIFSAKSGYVDIIKQELLELSKDLK